MYNIVFFTSLDCIKEVSMDLETSPDIKLSSVTFVSSLKEFKQKIRENRPNKILIDGKLPISFIKILVSEAFDLIGIYDINSNIFVFSEDPEKIKIPGVCPIQYFSELSDIR